LLHSLSGAIAECAGAFCLAGFRPHWAFLSTTLVKAAAIFLHGTALARHESREAFLPLLFSENTQNTC
jgi:hypothetical protein